LAKLLATAWSLAAGYRGGLVFPSIYSGVVIFLIVHALFGTSSNGILLGSVAGILGAMTGAVAGGIFVIAVIPYTLLPLAIVGIIGAAAGNRLIGKLSAAWKTSRS
jgi:H+/Cl- antiporter ClcA